MANGIFRTKAPGVISSLMARYGLTSFQAAGIVGNLGHECCGFTQLHEVNQPAGLGGYGWGQWTGPRRASFFAWTKANGLDWTSDAANIGYLFHELDGPYNGTIERLKNTHSLKEATTVFEQLYEGAGVPALDSRIVWARIAFSAYNIAKSSGRLA